MTTDRRIGILGGTFDPIHRGHVDVAEAAEKVLALTSLIVVPASVPPHRPQPVASSYHRFAMAALTVGGRPGWQVSDLELCGPQPSFTTTTLQRFEQSGYSPRELFFVIGADAFAEIATWKDYPGIFDRAHFAVISRPGHPIAALPGRLPALRERMITQGDGRPDDRPVIVLIDASTSDVSATAIRQRRHEGRSITGMVVPAVAQHIEQHGLYTSTASDRRAQNASTTAGAGRLHGKG
jgi:nicotinate-nucleotide adenylyltransferase